MVYDSGYPDSIHIAETDGDLAIYRHNSVIGFTELHPIDEVLIRALWLIDFLDLDDFDDITDLPLQPENDPFEIRKDEYLVMTEAEANTLVYERIFLCEGVWLFSPDFLSSETGLPEEVFVPLCEQCEGGNDAILSIVDTTCGRDKFIESVLSDSEARPMTLASYDGAENEVGPYLIYRIN